MSGDLFVAGRPVPGAVGMSVSGWSPYHGRRHRGAVITTVIGGRVVYDEGQIVAEPGVGRFVRPEAGYTRG